MGFIMDGLDAESYDRQYRDRDLVKRIFTYFRPQAGRIAIVALVIVLSSVVNTGLPIYISSVLDQLELEPETVNLITTTVIITGIGVLAWVFNFIRQRFQAEAVGNVVLKIREDAFDAVVNRDLSFYDTIPSGKIVSRVTSDTQAFSQVVTLQRSC
jgi:ABC-type multidrug transport system, ATPase and permease components